MEVIIPLLVLSTLAQHVVPDVPSVTSVKTVVEKVSGDWRIFSGESVRLRCITPDNYKSTWSYQWFRGSEKLGQSGEQFVLWNAHIKHSGKYHCQGERDTAVGKIYTLPSEPVEINVDGGWAILQVPDHPGLVGNTLMVTCRVRHNFPIHEVILYKDGIEVMRQNGPAVSLNFNLTNLSLNDNGMYSCRASWDAKAVTNSIISVAVPVKVLDVLSQPILEIVTDNDLIPAKKIKLICHVQYNAPSPAPPISYYFYRDNNRLGTATSDNHDQVRRVPGQYSCKAKVPLLDLSKWSEPKSYGEVAGPNRLRPPILHPRSPQPINPPVSSPDPTLHHTTQPTATSDSPHKKTHSDSTTTSILTLQPSQPTPSALPSPTQSVDQTVTPTQTKPTSSSQKQPFEMEESGEASGECGDTSGECGDTSGGSSDTSGGSSDTSGGSSESSGSHYTIH